MQERVDHGMAQRRKGLWLVLGALLISLFLSALDSTIIATALPTIVGDLGGLDHIAWVFTAYLLSSTVSVPLFGKISDIYGRKTRLSGDDRHLPRRLDAVRGSPRR